jgi:type IV pilus assembly protein PilO
MDKYLDMIAKAPMAVKGGVVAGIIALITAANFFLVIQPLEEQIDALRAEQAKLDSDLAEKSEIAQNLNERRREMDVLEQKLAEALTELPENRDVEELLSQLNDIGKKSGLELNKVEPSGETVSGGEFFARIPIKMSVSGSYHEVAVFLQEVANMRRIVNVSGIRLAAPSVKNERVVLQANFLATTFRFVDTKAAQQQAKK